MNKKTILLIVILLLCAGVLAFLGIRLNQESVSRQEAATLLDETRVLNTRLQEEKDSNGVLIERADATESVYFALLFEFDGDVNAIRHVLYNCTASRPTIESATKEASVEPGTETLRVTADPREDGLVKARTGDETTTATYNNWYKNVYVPGSSTSSSGTGSGT